MCTIELRDARCVSLRRASHDDLERVERLLKEQALPSDGVAESLSRFWVAERDGTVVGTAGVEVYGSSALLRSVAVDSGWRGTGLGRILTERALDEAKAAGVADIYLLTTTADRYFPRLGFACVEREAVPAAVTGSVEFQGVCPASAVVMHRRLGGEPDA